MKTTKMFDLTAQQMDDGTIRLTQEDYCGESCTIDLHTAQVQYLAEALGLLQPRAPAASPWPRGFVRRMERLCEQAHDLWALLASVPCFPPGGELSDDVIEAANLLHAVDDLLADFGITSDDACALLGESNGPPSVVVPCGGVKASAGGETPSNGRSEGSKKPSALSLF